MPFTSSASLVFFSARLASLDFLNLARGLSFTSWLVDMRSRRVAFAPSFVFGFDTRIKALSIFTLDRPNFLTNHLRHLLHIY